MQKERCHVYPGTLIGIHQIFYKDLFYMLVIRNNKATQTQRKYYKNNHFWCYYLVYLFIYLGGGSDYDRAGVGWGYSSITLGGPPRLPLGISHAFWSELVVSFSLFFHFPPCFPHRNCDRVKMWNRWHKQTVSILTQLAMMIFGRRRKKREVKSSAQGRTRIWLYWSVGGFAYPVCKKPEEFRPVIFCVGILIICGFHIALLSCFTEQTTHYNCIHN